MIEGSLSNIGTAARLTAKQHAFEFSAAAVASLSIAITAVLVAIHFTWVGVPPGCFATWLTSGPSEASCVPFLQQFGQINEDEANPFFAAMAMLPFAAGLIAGIPVVARELETKTAQTAWWLEPSRGLWLARQLIAPCLVLVVSIGIAAAAASVVQGVRESYSPTNAEVLARFGWPVLLRTFAALGIGLFIGSLMGRILPALILGSALCLGIFAATGALQAEWTYAQAKPVVDDPTWHGHGYGVAFVAPDGRTYSEGAAVGLAPPDAGNPYDWLSANGYREVEIGVSDATAVGWIPYDLAIYAAIGVVSTVAAFVTVSKRRPQ